MAMVMGGCAVFSLLALPSVRSDIKPLATSATRELFGFAAMLAGVVAGYFIGGWLLQLAGFDLDGTNPWLRLVFLVVRTGLAIALGLYLARRVGFDTLLKALSSYFASPGAWAFLALIVLYKVGDAFAMSLGTAFLIRGVGFEQLEVGLANKSVGLLMTIAGALIGGAVMMRVRLRTALMAFGVLQLVSNLGFYALSILGKGAWGVLTVPAFNLGIVALADPTPMDSLLLAAISIDNLSGGMGTAALVALLMGLCNLRFSATHFALLSAFASLGRVFIGPVAGVVADQFGWPQFFLVSLVVGAPSLFMVWWLRREIDAVDSRPVPVRT
jgi:PAT family beta-lactamase induction signal transducer AmpG